MTTVSGFREGGDAGDIRYGGYALGTEWLKTLRRAVVAVEFQTGNLGEPAEDGPAHVAAADKTITHRNFLPLL